MFSRITAAKNGRGAIRYAKGKEPGQNGRNLLVTSINMIPNGRYAAQMALLWRKARANHKVQVRRIIISFSKNELDPKNETDVELANTIVTEFIKTYYPDRQAALFFQNDGEGGCLHCHAIVNDISLTDHKGCTREQQYYKYVRKGIDAVAAKYIELDDGTKLASRQTHAEHAKAAEAAKIMGEHPELQGEELRKKLIQEKAYSYKEDMKGRIHEAALKSHNIVSFFAELKARGIEAIKKFSPKYGEHFVYNFKGCPVGAKNTKSRSYKLGYSYGPEAIQMIWDAKTREKVPQPETQLKNADDFTLWLKEHDVSCFEHGKDGRLTVNFDLMDNLYKTYQDTSAVMDISDLAATIKQKQRKKVKKTKEQALMADLQFSNNKQDQQQYDYSL